MTIIWSGLAPHPPIIVEAVGGARCAQVQPTIDAIRLWAADLVAAKPAGLILISPHTPRPRDGIAAWCGPRIQGSFDQFGAPQARIDLPVDSHWMDRFRRSYPNVHQLHHEPLDHGALVPLHFAVEAGWSGPTAVVGLPWDEGQELDRIGAALAQASDDGRPRALIASGDMSHCLKHGAPCGFDERGPRFDQTFVDLVRAARFREARNIDPMLRQAAKQDVVESCRIAWEATDYRHTNMHFYSYEGPFGVGYTVMRFFTQEAAA